MRKYRRLNLILIFQKIITEFKKICNICMKEAKIKQIMDECSKNNNKLKTLILERNLYFSQK